MSSNSNHDKITPQLAYDLRESHIALSFETPARDDAARDTRRFKLRPVAVHTWNNEDMHNSNVLF